MVAAAAAAVEAESWEGARPFSQRPPSPVLPPELTNLPLLLWSPQTPASRQRPSSTCHPCPPLSPSWTPPPLSLTTWAAAVVSTPPQPLPRPPWPLARGRTWHSGVGRPRPASALEDAGGAAVVAAAAVAESLLSLPDPTWSACILSWCSRPPMTSPRVVRQPPPGHPKRRREEEGGGDGGGGDGVAGGPREDRQRRMPSGAR